MMAEWMHVHGRLQELFQRVKNIYGENFEIHGTGTNEGAENKIELLKVSIF